MIVTPDQLELMLPYSTDRKRAIYITPLNTAMKQYEINTPMRISAFLAQVAHESGSLQYVEELADGSAYEYRKDLGNLEPIALRTAHANYCTTGKWFKGHGLIQITGYYNHKQVSEALGIDAVVSPRILCEPKYAALSAAWFWNAHNCNSLADVGLFDKITKVINGGYNGLHDRMEHYARCREVLGC